MKPRCALAVLLLAAAHAGPSLAHEVRPGYLELRERNGEQFDVRFRVPARPDARLGIHAVLPAHCRELTPRARSLAAGAFTERWTVACPGGIHGSEIRIAGLEATLTDVLARVERADGSVQIARLTPADPSFVVEAIPDALAVARTYLGLGVEHILLGIDHLLFVLALLLIVRGRRRLVGTITAFTVAHSITLAAATLGLVRIPQRPVEAVIALSIVFVAREIARGQHAHEALTASRPWIVAFLFGLLHGFGFAGALSDVGLPEQSIPLALLFFNVGVEAGQLLFIAAVLALHSGALRFRVAQPGWARPVLVYAIGALASYWTIDRVAGFWS